MRSRTVGAVHLFWDYVLSAFVLTLSRSHFLTTLSSCFEAQWLFEHMVLDDRICEDQLAVGNMLFTLNYSNIAIVVPLSEKTPSRSLQKCTSAVSKQQEANSVPSLVTLFSSVFSKWLLMETLVEDAKLKFSPEASGTYLENYLRNLHRMSKKYSHFLPCAPTLCLLDPPVKKKTEKCLVARTGGNHS